MDKKINLEEILSNAIFKQLEGKGTDIAKRTVANSSAKSDSSIFMKDAMLEFGKQLLELAAENAYVKDWYMDDKLVGKAVDKQSILDTINQVE